MKAVLAFLPIPPLLPAALRLAFGSQCSSFRLPAPLPEVLPWGERTRPRGENPLNRFKMDCKAAGAVAASPGEGTTQDAPHQTKLPLSMLTPKNGKLGAWEVCIAWPLLQKGKWEDPQGVEKTLHSIRVRSGQPARSNAVLLGGSQGRTKQSFISGASGDTIPG